MTPVSRNTEGIQKERNANRSIHSEFTEHSQQSLGTLNIGKSRVQATDQINTRQIPLTGYENFCQELQTYPVARDPMTVQPTGVDNVSSSALLDLPNINTNLPPPLLPNPMIALSFCFLRGFWDGISTCGCLGLCTGQPQIPCCVQPTDATAKKGGIPSVILRRVWRRWMRSGYPIVRVLLVVL